MIMKWFMVINNFEISIIPGSTSYELTNWQQNEPQRRRLNVEGEIYIISLFSPLSFLPLREGFKIPSHGNRPLSGGFLLFFPLVFREKKSVRPFR